ncbi:hypothetical protein C4K22_2634 [Pseudomonas chlororaphis subsp. aurantiaca]|nr:hypothetical protein C4K22_2634 [Pseudomonas chlororaphis subsp. aurantiaca]AZD41710.1 hypothetical protein C4K21_2636 [Pseudomonas chlororaphis subsp. aurantiaca]
MNKNSVIAIYRINFQWRAAAARQPGREKPKGANKKGAMNSHCTHGPIT